MEIIDCQVHIIDRDRPERPWIPGFAASLASTPGGEVFASGSAIVTDEEMIQAMDETGVDGAILVATSHYGFDNGYSLNAARARPGRFRVVGLLDPAAEDVEAKVHAWAAEPMAVGVRIKPHSAEEAEGPGFTRLLASAGEVNLPVCVFAPGFMSVVGDLARRFPNTRFVVDHLGMPQPPTGDPGPQPLRDLPDLLCLANSPNVAVKVSGMPSLSLEPFPFRDLDQPLRQIIEAFGIGRVMWGTDWTRVVHLYSYEDSLRFVTESAELNEGEKEALLGGTLRQIFRWPTDRQG